MTIAIFLCFVGLVLGISFWLGSRARSAQGYYAAHGQIPWFVNGIAFAGDYLSAASFLGICGMIATTGYDGFLYSIGFLAGWVVALFLIAEPIKRLGRFTFADALDAKFNSRGIKVTAAISTLVISVFYLIPQMVGAGAVMQALLGWEPWWGVLVVGAVVTTIVATAGMVSTTWVQFIKGSLLVVLCTILAVFILVRGLTTTPAGSEQRPFTAFRTATEAELLAEGRTLVPEAGAWQGKPYVRLADADGYVSVWRKAPDGRLAETQLIESATRAVGDGTTTVERRVNGVLVPKDVQASQLLRPVGHVSALPGGVDTTGPLWPNEFITTLQDSTVILWGSEDITDANGDKTKIFYQKPTPGAAVMQPGGGMFKGMDAEGEAGWMKKLNFISLLLALFAGTASLPHILIRYYTVKDQAAARKSTVVGIASIGYFYVLTLIIGLGAMTSGALDVTNGTMSAPLLAQSFGPLLFALISAVAFTTILGTVSGLIIASSGAIVHDLMTSVLKMQITDERKVLYGKIASIWVGAAAMALGILFQAMNPSFLVGWAFSIAASANLPALVMLLFWKGTTRQGITWAVTVGVVSSLAWVLVSAEAFEKVYGYAKADALKATLVPFDQPGIVTIPLGFAVLIVVSLLTRGSRKPPA